MMKICIWVEGQNAEEKHKEASARENQGGVFMKTMQGMKEMGGRLR